MPKCSTCKQAKSEDSYSKDRSRKMGIDLVCKLCRKNYAEKRKAPKRMGTLEELGELMGKAFQQLPPERQEKLRKEIYESMTGKPYRPSTEGG